MDDPFFSQEDYDLMEPSLDNDSDDSASESIPQQDDTDMTQFMHAMDAELLQHENTSRWLDGKVDHVVNDDSAVAQDVHVLSNLLKSLDAGAGGPGPIQNMLGEMGLRAPYLEPRQREEEQE